MREMSARLRSKFSCASLLALAHLGRQVVDAAPIMRPGWRRWRCATARCAWRRARRDFAGRGAARRPAACSAAAPSAAGRCRRGRSITGMASLDALDIRMRPPRGVRGEREIIGVGGHQHGGEGFAGFVERRPDQRIAAAGRALDDRIEPGHLLGRRQHLLLVGLRDGRPAVRASRSKPSRKRSVSAGQLRHRAGQHRDRWRRASSGCRARPRAAAGSRRRSPGCGSLMYRWIRLCSRPVSVPSRGQQVIGFAHLAHLVPGRAQHLGAAPDQPRQHHDDGAVERPRWRGCASGSAHGAPALRGGDEM